MIYSSWDIEQSILKLVILDRFLPFYHPKIRKNQNFENEKICWRHHHFTKNHNHMIHGSWDTGWDIEFFIILSHFLPCYHSPLYWSRGSKLKKKVRNMPGDIILLYIHVYYKWRSYDIWFLKYKVRQTEIFVLLGHFLPFRHLTTQKIKILKLKKNTWRYYHFTHLHRKWQSYDVWFLRYGAQ